MACVAAKDLMCNNANCGREKPKADSGQYVVDRDAPGVDLTVWIRDRSMDDTGLSWQEIRTLLRKLAQVMHMTPTFF